MKALNKYQVETAEKLLKDKLEEKKKAIGEAAFQADIAKHKPLVDAYNKAAKALIEKAREIKAVVEKNKKLEVDLDGYNSIIAKLAKDTEDDDDSNLISARSARSYGDNVYVPNLKKEEAEIDSFVLNLKLGTATMSDLQPLLDRIAKLK
jgi:hypothetical protein